MCDCFFLISEPTQKHPKDSTLTNTATAPELEARLTGASVAADCVDAQLVAGVGLLALVHVWLPHHTRVRSFSNKLLPHRQRNRAGRRTCAAETVGRPAEAPPTAHHTPVGANGVHAVLAVVARALAQLTLVDV